MCNAIPCPLRPADEATFSSNVRRSAQRAGSSLTCQPPAVGLDSPAAQCGVNRPHGVGACWEADSSSTKQSNAPHIMQPESAFSCSQEPAVFSVIWARLIQSIPSLSVLLRSILVLSPHVLLRLPRYFHISPTRIRTCVPHAPPISYSIILSYLVSSTDH